MSKKRQTSSRRKKSRDGELKSGMGRGALLYLAVPAVVIIAVVVGISSLTGGSAAAPVVDNDDAVLPVFIRQAPLKVREAYAYAVQNPDALQYVPCYCGCGEPFGHESVHDCFVHPDSMPGGPVVYDSHGANCGICVETVLSTKEMLSRGSSLEEVRRFVDARFGDIAPGTNTAPVP